MIVYEAKLKGSHNQYQLLDEAIHAGQFIRNKALGYWISNQKLKRGNLLKLCTELRRKYLWCRKLSAQACQSSVDRAWKAISRFQQNCYLQLSRKKSYPKFKKNSRSIEYKSDGWKLSDDKRQITFRDGFMAGEFQLVGTRNLHFYQSEQIKRVRVIRRADGYYCQFCIDYNRVEKHIWTGKTIGIYRGGESFFTDSDGNAVEILDLLQKTYKAFKRRQRNLSRKARFSKNRDKAKIKLGKAHLKLSRRRKDWVCKTAQALVKSADLIVYEDIKQLKTHFPKNSHKLDLLISKYEWQEFLRWIEFFAKIHGIITIVVSPEFERQENCRDLGRLQQERNIDSHKHNKQNTCLHQEQKIATKILAKGLSLLGEKREEINKLLNTVGRTEINACGDLTTNIIEETHNVKSNRRIRKS